MDYAFVVSSATGSTRVPTLLPNGDHYVAVYGHLIHRGERVRLDEFAARIEAHYDTPRTTIEAGEIRRWFNLMAQATDRMTNSGELPQDFQGDDGVYDREDCRKILGDAAIKHLLAAGKSPLGRQA